jgi:cytochrome c peroxidase
LSFKAALLATVLAVGLGAAPPPSSEWSGDEVRVLSSLSIDELGPVPPDPSSRVADSREAAELGRLLFNDRGLSANGKVSCATCHDPASGFTDLTPTGRGIGVGTRRTMPIVPAVHSPWQFWDGRADSLWAQALGPLENPLEHGFTRGEVAAVVRTRYAGHYTRLFGQVPAVEPGRASPLGDLAAQRQWASMPEPHQEAVNRVFVNVGKAIAAFERQQKPQNTRFDRYIRSLASGSRPGAILSAQEIAGLRIFIGKGQCVTCHSGPLLTNNDFANTGVPMGSGGKPDRGRSEGVRTALSDPFNCRGRFSDDPERRCSELDFAVMGAAEQVGAFKVPSLRGAASRAPFVHAGQFRTLEQVVRHYPDAPLASIGRSQLRALGLSEDERQNLVAFLKTLDPLPSSGDLR